MVAPEAEDDCCGEKNKEKTKAHNQTAFNDVADRQTLLGALYRLRERGFGSR